MNRRSFITSALALLSANAFIPKYAYATDEWALLREKMEEASRYMIFELNDPETRQTALDIFKPLCEKYGFRAICDETNNPPNLIEMNGFAISFTKDGKTKTLTSVISNMDFSEIDE